jgi:hypothetical protein
LKKKRANFSDVQKIFKLHEIDIDKIESWVKIRELKFLANTITFGNIRFLSSGFSMV